MPNKSSPNGFYIFMQAERHRLQELNKTAPSMQDMAVLCAEPWKHSDHRKALKLHKSHISLNLSAAEKANYDEIAKQEKLRLRNDPNKNKFKMDNQRQIIAERVDPVREDRKRRTMEVQTLMKSWEGQDILDIRFHLINFQVMYNDEPDDGYLPMEVGLVCFTLREGIIGHMHHLIDPGDAPQGNRHIALKHSENTHNIPLCYEKANDNFLEIWKGIEKFVANDRHGVEKLPIFCQKDQRNCVESCLDYIRYRAHQIEPNRLSKVYTLEDLVITLITQSGKTDQRPSEAQVRDSLLQNQWDSNSSIRCSYHDELDCSYCSLAIVKRFCFCLFDQLSNILNFKMTAQHMPIEAEMTSFIVKYPVQDVSANSQPIGREIYNRSTTTSTVSSQSTSPNRSSGCPWDASRVNKVEVQLSETESDCGDEAVFTDEVRSTADQYTLQELRKPIIPAFFGRGMPRWNSPVRPPPGFEPMSATSMLYSNDFPSLSHKNPHVEPVRLPTPTTNLRGVGRARGLPPQLLPFQRPKF